MSKPRKPDVTIPGPWEPYPHDGRFRIRNTVTGNDLLTSVRTTGGTSWARAQTYPTQRGARARANDLNARVDEMIGERK